ncbi:MAG: sodium:proline symporter, partial [Coriobacteriia bacterium]|nr:sodium:proline symporter [Coriobacteriia bacterium]
VSYAWAGFGASFGPLVIMSLYWRRTNFAGALAGMLGGAGMVFLWHEVISGFGGVFAVYELLPAFLFSMLCIVVVSLLTAKPEEEVLEEFDHYMEADC